MSLVAGAKDDGFHQSDNRKRLGKLYRNYNLPGSLQGQYAFSKNRQIPKKQTKEVLESLQEYSLFRPVRHRFKTRKFIIPWMKHTFGADLIVLTQYSTENSGFNYILVVEDLFSRFLYTAKLKSKHGDVVAHALKQIIKKSGGFRFLMSDEGTEFFCRPVKELLDKNKIIHYKTFSGKKVAMVERGLLQIWIKKMLD